MTSSVQTFLRKAWHSWATRSLAIGALATAMDIGVGLLCLEVFHSSTRVGAMLGVGVGATFTFFANRRFAFKEANPKLAAPALKFLLLTAASMLLHGQLVVWMCERLHMPFVPAKMIADIGVFTFGQLLVLRYLVFPKSKTAAALPQKLEERPAPQPSWRSRGSSTAAS